MSSMSFEQVLHAAEQLTPQEQHALVEYLCARSKASSSARGALLRERIGAEFARPDAPVGADEVESYLRSLSTEWEEDLDDLVR